MCEGPWERWNRKQLLTFAILLKAVQTEAEASAPFSGGHCATVVLGVKYRAGCWMGPWAVSQTSHQIPQFFLCFLEGKVAATAIHGGSCSLGQMGMHLDGAKWYSSIPVCVWLDIVRRGGCPA